MINYIQINYLSLLNFSFIACFFLLFVWEQLIPWKKTLHSLPVRWWNNISLFLLNKYLLFWLIPFTVIPVAIYAKSNSLGILNIFALNSALTLILGFFLYDLSHYILHRLLHINSVLWRFHRVHHSDPDVDISTELKHHPLESLFNFLFSVFVVLVFGIPPVAIIFRSFFTQVISLFSHANVKLTEKIDQLLRLVIITPAMHLVHHSSYRPETDSNYGTLLSVWDRLFNTYIERPELGYEYMRIGLDSFRSKRELWLDQLLLQPFNRKMD